MWVWVYAHTWAQDLRKAKGVEPPGAGAEGDCELPDVGAGN